MSEMKRRIESMERRIESLQTQMSDGFARIDAKFEQMDGRSGQVDKRLHALTVEQARARGDIEWLKENMLTRGEYREGMSLLLGRLDGIAGTMEGMRYSMAKQNNRLDDHETRISRIEGGGA
jgi:DNA repair exonuclease SbcCD ATPase subunit